MKERVVYTTNSAMEADVIMQYLAAEDIDAVCSNRGMAELYAGVGGEATAINIMVDDINYDKAIEVLKAYHVIQDKKVIHCPHCGSTDIGTIRKNCSKFCYRWHIAMALLMAKPLSPKYYSYICHHCSTVFDTLEEK